MLCMYDVCSSSYCIHLILIKISFFFFFFFCTRTTLRYASIMLHSILHINARYCIKLSQGVYDFRLEQHALRVHIPCDDAPMIPC